MKATTFLLWALALACLVIGLLHAIVNFSGAFASPYWFRRRVSPPHGRSLDSAAPGRNRISPTGSPACTRYHLLAYARSARARSRGSAGGEWVPAATSQLEDTQVSAVLSVFRPFQRLEMISTRLVLPDLFCDHRPCRRTRTAASC